MSGKLDIVREPAMPVFFYGRLMILDRREAAFGRHRYGIREEVVDRDRSVQGEPQSRHLEVFQEGSMNWWCAEFEVRSPACALLSLNAWAETPQQAVDLLMVRVQQVTGLVGGWARA